MNLQIAFDDDLMTEYVNRGSPAFFYLHWANEGIAYPSAKWMDFGLVLLGWWIMALRTLIDGQGQVDFDFMDGPYCLKLKSTAGSIAVEHDGAIWTTTLLELVTEIDKGVNVVIQKVSGFDPLRGECAALRAGMSALWIAYHSSTKQK